VYKLHSLTSDIISETIVLAYRREMMLCEDELQHLMRDCEPSFVITDSDHIDSVQFASSTQSEATNLNVCLSESLTYSHHSSM